MSGIARLAFPGLVEELRRPEASILLGARQVGKTFLLRKLEKAAARAGLRTKYFDLELPQDLMALNKTDAQIHRILTEGADVVFLDEFHYLKNASKAFKAVFDEGRGTKIFASGSSAIRMHAHLKESLAGRRLTTKIGPLSFAEFRKKSPSAPLGRMHEEFVTFGGLPGLLKARDAQEKIRLLAEILATYIQKDVKSLIKEENIRAFNNLIYLLAENQGSLISENSLSREIGLTAATVNRHLAILEGTYVCSPVYSYARRLGNELKKSKKVYFYDLGIRNALLKDFSPLAGRADRGAVQESFVFLEIDALLRPNMEIRFWRNKAGQEIDFVILKDRRPFLVEVKGALQRPEIPPAMRTFLTHYPETAGAVVFRENPSARARFNGRAVRFEPISSAPEVLAELLG